MRTKLVEATDEMHFNHGKFMVAVFDHEEWARTSTVDEQAMADLPGGPLFPPSPLLHRTGWDFLSHVIVFDLQTGEGARFRLGGMPKADLDKHRVWVCLLFEPFLEWLYERARNEKPFQIEAIPDVVVLPNKNPGLAGYRRAGPDQCSVCGAHIARSEEDLRRPR